MDTSHYPWNTQNDPTSWARDDDWLAAVAGTPERDLRGHRIALTYHTLAIDLFKWIYEIDTLDQSSFLQKPTVNANWFSFSTWATATLNADIRNDDTPYRSDRLLPFGFRRQLTPTVLKIKGANRQRYNQLLTWYQRLVFINTTFAYAALRTNDPGGNERFAWVTNERGIELAEPKPENQPSWTSRVADLARPPGGDSVLTLERHFKPVAMAFEYYRRARRVTLTLAPDTPGDERSYFQCLRARLIFFGNLILTSVEQDVVDPGVERVLNNVPTAANAVVSNHLADLAERMLGVPRQLAGVRLPVKLKPVQDSFQEVWVRLLTRELLVLALPAEVLRLGRDIPPLTAGGPYFPNELFGLSRLPGDDRTGTATDYGLNFDQHVADNADLERMVWAFDRSRGNGHGTGARDWRRYAERMNWATTLMRSRIQDTSLFWPPFRNEDAARIYDGQLPTHNGNPTDFDVLGPLQGFPYLCGGGETARSEEP